MRRKDDNKLTNIFDATLELVTSKGLSETSVSKIAKKANISSSTIYVYFESKEDLLIKLYVKLKKNMSKSIFDSIENSSEFKESFKILLNNFINYIIENPDIFLFIEQFNNSPLYNKIPQEYYDDLYQLHDSFYQKGKEQNLLKDVSIYLLTVYTYYPVVQLIKTYFSGEVELTDSNIESVLQMSWDAIKV